MSFNPSAISDIIDFLFEDANEGDIIKFYNDRLNHTTLDHYHVITHIDDNEFVIAAVGTSQKDNLIKRAERLNNGDLSSISCVQPSSNNSLSKDTYIDCNDGVFLFEFDEIDDLSSKTNFEYSGCCTLTELYEIRMAVRESNNENAIIKNLLGKGIDDWYDDQLDIAAE